MDSFFQIGNDFIRVIQEFREPWLDRFFIIITFLGSMKICFFFFPLLFWCVDYRLGARVSVIYQISGNINFLLKNLFKLPRPFELALDIDIVNETGYGLPSGHAQNTLVFWGSLSVWMKKKWFWVASCMLVFLVGFSRIYLGVHFPIDVLAGWLIGLAILLSYFSLYQKIESWLVNLSFHYQLLISGLLPCVILLSFVSQVVALMMGYLAGTCIGIVIKSRYIVFDAGGTFWKRILRYILGILIKFSILILLTAVFQEKLKVSYILSQFLTFISVGLWMSAGAPWIFTKLKM
jgi:membrane-associated phospholipid phosphatase